MKDMKMQADNASLNMELKFLEAFRKISEESKATYERMERDLERRGLLCALCPKGEREIDEDGADVDPRGRPHIHIQQIDKNGRMIWGNTYMDVLVPFSKVEDAIYDVSEALGKVEKKG